jgi:hypothetical protein
MTAGRRMASDAKVCVCVRLPITFCDAVSSKFGYGLMDAEAVVRLAQQWTTVPTAHKCEYEYQINSNDV